MSNDDLENLPPLGGNPLEGELESLPPPSGNPLGGDMLEEMGPATSLPPLEGDAAQGLPPLGDEGAVAVVAGEGIPEAEAQPEEPAEEKPGFLAKLAEANPYTVILAASLVALLIGILCLLLEWGSYNFDTKATDLGRSTPVSAPLDSGVVPSARVATLA